MRSESLSTEMTKGTISPLLIILSFSSSSSPLHFFLCLFFSLICLFTHPPPSVSSVSFSQLSEFHLGCLLGEITSGRTLYYLQSKRHHKYHSTHTNVTIHLSALWLRQHSLAGPQPCLTRARQKKTNSVGKHLSCILAPLTPLAPPEHIASPGIENNVISANLCEN